MSLKINKTRAGKAFIVCGVLLVVLAGCLFVAYRILESRLETNNASTVFQLSEHIDACMSSQEESGDLVCVDENWYVAILEIPSQGVVVPIQSTWSDSNLNTSPCVYKDSPYSIAGHNFDAHFGCLDNLAVGDLVTLTSMTGQQDFYEVVSVEIIEESDVEMLDDYSYDLTLFTCNEFNNSQRVLVRLVRVLS